MQRIIKMFVILRDIQTPKAGESRYCGVVQQDFTLADTPVLLQSYCKLLSEARAHTGKKMSTKNNKWRVRAIY